LFVFLLFGNVSADLFALVLFPFVFGEGPKVILAKFRATRTPAPVTVLADPLICKLKGFRRAANLARLGFVCFIRVHDGWDGLREGGVSARDVRRG